MSEFDQELQLTNTTTAHRAAIVFEASRQMLDGSPSNSFQDALITLAFQARLAIGAHQSAISYLPGGEFTTAIHGVSLSEKYAKYRSYDVPPTGKGIWSLVLRQKQGVCMTEAELVAHPLWARFSNLKDARGLEHPPMRGWLATPVVQASGEAIGVLHLSDKFDDADFTAADLDTLVRLAAMVMPTFELQFANQRLQDLTEELTASRNELELRVRERTVELEMANRELQERTNRFELVAAGACDAMWDWDVAGHRVFFSARWKELRGYAPDELSDREEEWRDGIHPDDRSRVLAAVTAHFEGKTAVFEAEYRVRCKDGSWKWIHGRCLAQSDANGQAIRMAGSESDITERKHAEEALRLSEQRFRDLFHNSPDAIFVEDLKGYVLDANPAACQLHHCERKNLVGRHIRDLVPPEQLGEILAQFQRLVRGELNHFESFSYTTDGLTIPIELRANSISIEGQPCLLLQVRDITERRQAEARIRASEELFRSVVQGSLHGILINQDNCIRFANPALVRMFGYERSEQLLNASLVETIVAQDDHVLLRERIASTYVGRTLPLSRPWKGIRRDGSHFWIVSTSSPVQWKGRPAIVAFLHDIDDRKRAEDANDSARRMLQLVLDHIPQGVFWKDRNSKFIGCNKIVAKAHGFENPTDLHDLDDRQFPGVTPEQAAHFLRSDRAVMEANQPIYNMLEPLTLADGRSIWIETTKVPLQDGPGKVIGILGTWQDVTERKRLAEERQRFETQLQHTQKLESLGVLAGGIAHDFNNLLTSVLGFADLALLELPRESTARDHIAAAADGARRAAELTNQMLAYSGKGRFVVETLDVSAIVENLTRLLQITISKKCAVKFNLAPDLPLIEADAAQVRQIVMNLIINASEAIGDHSGAIAVTTGVMHCDRAYLSKTYLDDNLEAGEYVFIEVADTGIGMSEETQARIFDPFFTTKFTGRGLGLSAVLGIVRGHKGALKCYSELSKGTTFKVLFPSTSLPALMNPPRNATEAPWQGEGLALVVDDEESIRSLARRMLEAMGFKVLTAADGREGVEVFRLHADKLRFVLLDMTMPKLDGEETFREMRRIRSDVKAILTSGYNEQTATSRFAGKGLAAFIQKPYGFADLREVIRKAITPAT